MTWRFIVGLLMLYFVLVTTKKKKLRSHKDKKDLEWSWDTWCHLQAKVGNCSGRSILYYYDTMTGQCRQYLYSGCNGNQNQFGTMRDCNQFCQGISLIPEGRSLAKSEVCSMQPNPGVCIASMTRFYYNVNTRSCSEFVYGGCGGNANRFPDKRTCMHECKQSGA